MIDLVRWSLILGLTPLVLDLSWALICALGRYLDLGASLDIDPMAEPRRSPGFSGLDLYVTPCPVSRSARF